MRSAKSVSSSRFFKLLSDAEGAVRSATDTTTPMAPAHPTEAVKELTWNKVLMKLTPSVPRPHLPSPYLRLVKTAS